MYILHVCLGFHLGENVFKQVKTHVVQEVSLSFSGKNIDEVQWVRVSLGEERLLESRQFPLGRKDVHLGEMVSTQVKTFSPV